MKEKRKEERNSKISNEGSQKERNRKVGMENKCLKGWNFEEEKDCVEEKSSPPKPAHVHWLAALSPLKVIK